MSVVSREDKGSGSSWFGWDRIASSLPIATNMAFEVARVSIPSTLWTNGVLRSGIFLVDGWPKNYKKVACSAVAFFALAYFNNRLPAIVIDALYMGICEHEKRRSGGADTGSYRVRKLDPTVPSQARRMLGLSSDELITLELLDRKRDEIVQRCEASIETIGSGPIIEELREMIEAIKQAHTTLCKEPR